MPRRKPPAKSYSEWNKSTKITAFKMVDELDAGPVYLKESLSLEGNAEEIYYKASYLSARMIQRIIEEQPEPKPQEGKVTTFKRRKPREVKFLRNLAAKFI